MNMKGLASITLLGLNKEQQYNLLLVESKGDKANNIFLKSFHTCDLDHLKHLHHLSPAKM